MLRGIYSVANAMEIAGRNHEILSENIVHAATPGYRRQGLLFDASSATPGEPANSAASGSNRAARNGRAFQYFEAGPLQQTNNPLDVAVTGDAFFVVNGPDGPLYTRNGAFIVDQNGSLRTRGGGYQVSGQGGPINLPADAGPITIGPDGSVSTNGAQVGQLRLARFAQPETLRRVGTTLFEGDAPQTPPPGSVRVEQGYREGSNVQPVHEMVQMLVGMRYYEAAAKALQSLSDAVAQNTRTQTTSA